MASKKDISITFRIDDSYNDWIREQCRALNVDESELARACILIAAPILRAYPILIPMIQSLPKPSQ